MLKMKEVSVVSIAHAPGPHWSEERQSVQVGIESAVCATVLHRLTPTLSSRISFDFLLKQRVVSSVYCKNLPRRSDDPVTLT